MALFNFSFNAPSSPSDSSSSSSASSGEQVILQYNAASVTIDADDAEGLSVQELFEQYADKLDDPDTHSATFMRAGSVINGSTSAKPGTVYRAMVTCDTKGA